MPKEGQNGKSFAAANLIWGKEQARRLDDFAHWYECLREAERSRKVSMQDCLDKIHAEKASKPVARITP